MTIGLPCGHVAGPGSVGQLGKPTKHHQMSPHCIQGTVLTVDGTKNTGHGSALQELLN